jgi:hypothetical protein
MTLLSPASAGRITSSSNCARDAEIRRSSAMGDIAVSFLCFRHRLTCSPKCVPPGSWVNTVGAPAANMRRCRAFAWVLLPHPSHPSKTTNRANGHLDAAENLHSAIGFLAETAGCQLRAFGQEVLQTPHIRGLRAQFHRIGTVHDLTYRLLCLL